MYLAYFGAKHALKVRTPVGRVMTSTRTWAEQPKPGEQPLRLAPSVPGTAVGGGEWAPIVES
jgi:hypothetical protein